MYIDVRFTAGIKLMGLLFCMKRNAFTFGINWKSSVMHFEHLIHTLQDAGLQYEIERT